MFNESRLNPMLTTDQLAVIVRDFYDYVLDQENRLRFRLGPIPEEARLKRAEFYRQVADQTRTALASNNFDDGYLVSLAMMRKHGLDGKLDEIEKKQFRQAILRGGIELAEAVRARYEGNFDYEPKDRLLREKVDAAFSPVGAPPVVEPPLDVRQPTPAGPMFSKTAASFVSKQKQLRRWENQTAAQNEKSYELFVAICGDHPVGKYAKKDAAKFKDVMERMPAMYGKAAQYLGKTPEQILKIDAASGGQDDRLSTRTVKRHISALSGLWDELIPRGDAKDNIFSGFKFPQQQRAQDQRPMWTRTDLVRLFQTPIWTGCKSEHRRSTAGGEIIRDEKFWLPLIAVFSGARQEEICQLHVEDIRVEEGVWLFDINMKPPRKLKNQSAIRLVPVHKELIKLGFFRYLDERRQAGDARVFPHLKPGGADGRLGHGFTKWFTRYRRDVGAYEEGRDFHSFRHSATTFLHQGGAGDSIVDRLTGHTTPGETARYAKSSNISQLEAAVDGIDIGVRFDSLYLDEPETG